MRHRGWMPHQRFCPAETDGEFDHLGDDSRPDALRVRRRGSRTRTWNLRLALALGTGRTGASPFLEEATVVPGDLG